MWEEAIMAEESLEVNKYRKALPQFLATTAKNLLLLDLGIILAFPALVIGSLLHSEEEFHLNDTEASWFGSITFICQPIGSLASGSFVEYFGRKRSMLLVNIPLLLGWYLFYFSYSLQVLFVAGVMMGLGAGFMEAPIITYVGEICEPSMRGILISYSSTFVSSGITLGFFLGTLYYWRTVALISSFIPIITFIVILQVPETPMWLLAKGRMKDAEKSLCWLRGWVSPNHIRKEFNELIQYNSEAEMRKRREIEKINLQNEINLKTTETLNEKEDTDEESEIQMPLASTGTYKSSLLERLSELKNPRMWRPLVLTISCFAFYNGTGCFGIRPYMVKVLEELNVPTDPHWVTVMMSFNSFLGIITCGLTIRYVGNRKLYLTSLSGCACCMLLLSLWLFLRANSGDTSSSWTPVILFILLSYSFSLGTEPLSWMILSEVFPYRGRGMGTGIAAASSYVLGFVVSNSFLTLKHYLGLSLLFSLYGAVSLVGIMYIYFKLPDTEGKSLQQIENYFNKKTGKLRTSKI